MARRLDAGPGDDAVVRLVRELRLVTLELRARADVGGTSDVEQWLAGLTDPSFRDSQD